LNILFHVVVYSSRSRTSDVMKEAFYKMMLNAMPAPVFVVDQDVRIIDSNEAAAGFTGTEAGAILHGPAGGVLHCLNAVWNAGTCGASAACKNCIIRRSTQESFLGQKVVRRKTDMLLEKSDGFAKLSFWVTTSPFEHEGQRYVLLILEDISELIELREVLPICSHCKKIRSDQKYWDSVEAYFKKYWNLDFSHSICPDCMKEHYPDVEQSASLTATQEGAP
ncbi:MAG: PAS domain-containing protein, partial [Lentisphaerota bacterium]